MCCEMGFMHLEAAIWNSKASATFDPPSRRQFYSSSFTISPLSSRRATSSINPLSLLSTFDTPKSHGQIVAIDGQNVALLYLCK